MSQYNSRIHIKVKEPSVWKKFKDVDDAEFELAGLSKEGCTSFVLDDWCCIEEELKGIVSALAETLGEDGIIIADTTDINVNPYAYIVYSAGYGVHDKYQNNSEYCFATNVFDLVECLNYKNHFAFNAKELNILKQNGIGRVKEGHKFIFKKLLENEGLEDEIFLTETRFEGRTKRIETVKKGDSVKLVHDTNDKTYKHKVDVITEAGSLGLLDDKSAKIMAPIIDAGEKEYVAVIQNVVPQSKRRPGCQTATISVHIQFKTDPLEDNEHDKTKNNISSKVIGGSDDIPFSYGHIDDISTGFYEGVWNGKEFVISKDATITVLVEGKAVNVKVQTKRKMKEISKKFESPLCGNESTQPFYDPTSAINGNLEQLGDGKHQPYLYEVSDDAEELNAEQIAHRVKLFAKTVSLLNEEAVMTKIIQAAPKKKNGTLYAKRVTQVASLFCMEKDASMYVLCAVAKDDSNLVMEIRTIITTDLKKAEEDVITKHDLFRSI